MRSLSVLSAAAVAAAMGITTAGCMARPISAGPAADANNNPRSKSDYNNNNNIDMSPVLEKVVYGVLGLGASVISISQIARAFPASRPSSKSRETLLRNNEDVCGKELDSVAALYARSDLRSWVRDITGLRPTDREGACLEKCMQQKLLGVPESWDAGSRMLPPEAYELCRGPGEGHCNVPASSRYRPYHDILEDGWKKQQQPEADERKSDTNDDDNSNNNAFSFLPAAAVKNTRDAIIGRLDAASNRLGSALNQAAGATSNTPVVGTPQTPVGMIRGDFRLQPMPLR
ncbi:MAG: hypothetical protein M1816_002884 [Peltula sp. TS41687]|nr:MAG: hypothetical protein M1816_002884 [Peltula sp. TS41687]